MSTAIPLGAPAAPDSAPAVDALFATETMAELSARQGRIADAVTIYRHLLARGAGGAGGAADEEQRARWVQRLAALERATLTKPSTDAAPNRAGGLDNAHPASPRATGAEQAPHLAHYLAPSAEVASPPARSPEKPPLHLPLVVRQPVRSGQIVYAESSDLIVLAPVNPGGELLADGNIHVYASLRGRAIAGARGATGAQVFCLDLQAELVGVDSGYVACAEIPHAFWGKAARVWLRDGRCQIEALTLPSSPALGRTLKL